MGVVSESDTLGRPPRSPGGATERCVSNPRPSKDGAAAYATPADPLAEAASTAAWRAPGHAPPWMARVEALQPGRVCGLGVFPSPAPEEATSPAPGSPSAAPASARGAQPRLRAGAQRAGPCRKRDEQLATGATAAGAKARMAAHGTAGAKDDGDTPQSARTARTELLSRYIVQRHVASLTLRRSVLRGPAPGQRPSRVCCRRCGALAALCAPRRVLLAAPAPLRACCAPAARAARPPRRAAARQRLCARGGSTAACRLSVEVTALSKIVVPSLAWCLALVLSPPRCAPQPPRPPVRSRSHRGAQARRTPAAGARHGSSETLHWRPGPLASRTRQTAAVGATRCRLASTQSAPRARSPGRTLPPSAHGQHQTTAS